ncbi:hypothetical protein [Agrobacterium tumefaciens]|uniref:hypothetical protein n=1 Tax=Agrobacterium tumefaciens TaxID=358 RepID=UPI001571E202|nr:hypothetical protein [Agrobacterium tumefaciens]
MKQIRSIEIGDLQSTSEYWELEAVVTYTDSRPPCRSVTRLSCMVAGDELPIAELRNMLTAEHLRMIASEIEQERPV